MGTISSVACKTCKVTRNLDKYESVHTIGDRKGALEFSEYLERKEVLFREGLLISFMNKHKGHECVLFDEHSSCNEELNGLYENNYKSDIDYFDEE